jgi:hypothetical protein
MRFRGFGFLICFIFVFPWSRVGAAILVAFSSPLAGGKPMPEALF